MGPQAGEADQTKSGLGQDALAESALTLPNSVYYPEDDSIFTRVGPCSLFNFMGFPAAIAGDTDIYGDCGVPSVTWTLIGPGTLAIHQFDNGHAILSVDGIDVLNLSGGCFAGNVQTYEIVGAGIHSVKIDRMQDIHGGCDFASWGFDGIEWTGIWPGIPSEGSSLAWEWFEHFFGGGDPVNTATGAFLYSTGDVAIKGRGPSPAFGRSYNSLDTRPGPLGPGWTHGYNVRLRHPDDGSPDLMFVGADGNTDRFVANGDGTFSPPPAVYKTLVKNPDGSHTVADKSRAKWTFDAVGHLVSLADRDGNTSIISYTGNLPTSISDPAGRGVLTLGYTSGRLTSVSDWVSPARTVTYQYDANGRLWKVTDREGKTTTFGYDGTSVRLTTITDARGNVALTMTYDAQGRVATQKDAQGVSTGATTSFDYVVNGDGTRVTTVTYPGTSFEPSFAPSVEDTYNAQGWIIERESKPTSSETLSESFTYDVTGNQTSLTDHRGNTTTFCYDIDYSGSPITSRGNLTRRIGPAFDSGANRSVTLFAYDSKDNPTQIVAPNGVPAGTVVTCSTNLSAIDTSYSTDMAYDVSGVRLLSTTGHFTDPDNGAAAAKTTFEYGDAANPGRVTRITPPRGNTGASPDPTYSTTMSYFASGPRAGMLASTTDALGNTTTYDYDAVGRLIKTTDPLGNAAGGVPAQHATELVYDKEDRLRFVKAPAPTAGGSQLVTEHQYDSVGNRTVQVHPNGQVTTYAYDNRDGLFQVKESPNAWTDSASPPSGLITTEYAYDAAGNMTRLTRAKADATYERATDYTYDGRRLVRSEKQYPAWPATTGALVTSATYDPNGMSLVATDALSRTKTNTYDALNRVIGINYSDAGTPDVTFDYDANGNRTSMVDGTGVSSYVYDESDRLLSVTSPGPKTIGFRYDLDGNRTKLIYPDSTAVSYTFDKASRMTSLQDWASRTVGYGYDPDGALKTATNPNGTTATYSYDNTRRVVDIVHKLGSTVFDRRTYGLDAVGNVTAEANASLAPQFARPDGFGASNGTWTGTFAAINEAQPNDTTFIASPSGPTAANFYEVTLSDIAPPGGLTGLTVRYRYAKSGNNSGQTTNLVIELRQGSTVIASGTHNNIPGVTGSGWQPGTITLTATQASSITDFAALRLRIRPSTSGGGQQRKAQVSWSEFQVPGPGDPATGSTYGYDRLSRITSVAGANGSRTYTYDPIGNRLTKVVGGTTNYTYDRADRITTAGPTSITVNAVGATTARGTDTFAYDQINRLKTATLAGVSETYAYDGDGVRFSRQVDSGAFNRYVTDPVAQLPVTIDDGTRKYVWGLGLAYSVSGSGIEVHHADRLGSIRAMTNATGAVVATFRTDEFGVPTTSTGAAESLYRYTGEPRDASGLTYLRARYYDPSVGRFLTRDSFSGFGAAPLSLNRYSYVANNPTTWSDPSGRHPCIPAAGAGALAGSVVPGAGTAGGALVGFILCAAAFTAGVVVVTNVIIEETKADPTHQEWSPPIYNQPPAPRLPQGDPGNQNPFNPLDGWQIAVAIAIVISIIASNLAGWDVHLNEPLFEPDEEPPKPNVLEHGQ